MDATSLDSYLGAGRVVRLGPGALSVALEDATAAGTVVNATPALTFPYRPVLGDQLLVLGDARAFYVIGVLAGRGSTTLSRAAGVSLRAEGGALRLTGDRGVRLTGSSIQLRAQRLRRLAALAVQTFGEQERHIRDRLTVEAGDLDEHSRGRWLLQARRVVLKALIVARIKSTTVRVG
jgi:hypothetical protein